MPSRLSRREYHSSGVSVFHKLDFQVVKRRSVLDLEVLGPAIFVRGAHPHAATSVIHPVHVETHNGFLVTACYVLLTSDWPALVFVVFQGPAFFVRGAACYIFLEKVQGQTYRDVLVAKQPEVVQDYRGNKLPDYERGDQCPSTQPGYNDDGGYQDSRSQKSTDEQVG